MRNLLSIRSISKSYGHQRVLDAITLDISEKETVCVLGPSGSGKSTLLKIIAGATAATEGRIDYCGKQMSYRERWSPEIVMVWQSMALFPHYSVEGNIAFGLAVRGWSREKRRRSVAEALELVELPGFEGRRIGSLSGGEQQRVALARALVIKPKLLLLDEPFGSLDAHLRSNLVGKMREIHARFGLTLIMVTHDQAEAVCIAERLAILRAGKMEQVGSSEDVCQRPKTGFVARFVGRRNVSSATVIEREGDRATLKIGEFITKAQVPSWVAGDRIHVGADVAHVVEPNNVHVDHKVDVMLNGVITSRVVLDGRVTVEVNTPPVGTIRLDHPGTSVAGHVGEQLCIGWNEENAYVLPEAT